MALTAGQIVKTAHDLVAQYGLQDVSMRRVAGELGVRPGALYYHLPNKQEMLRQVAHRMLDPLRNAVGAPSELMCRLRQTLLPLRDGGDLTLIAYALDPELPPVPALRAALLNAGQTRSQAAERASVLMRYALGAVAVEQNARMFGTQTEDDALLYERAVSLLVSTAEDLNTVQ